MTTLVTGLVLSGHDSPLTSFQVRRGRPQVGEVLEQGHGGSQIEEEAGTAVSTKLGHCYAKIF